MNGNTIYHLEFHSGAHHYYGSITAMYQIFDAKTLGVSKGRLYNFKLTPENPYMNKVCTIRKGDFKRIKTNRKLPTQTEL